ncbi:hypothetical protein CEXT_645101, partial [Caerostris extrusa]
SYTYQKV